MESQLPGEVNNATAPIPPYTAQNPAEQPVYQHRPMTLKGEFRILRLAPSLDKEAAVRGTLEHVTWSSKPSYEAISYTWGKSEPRGYILLDDVGWLSVTQNCEAALRCFRRPTEERWLWIDAVCINQSDITERSRQVTIMGHIYFCCKHTNVFLDTVYSHDRKLDDLFVADPAAGLGPTRYMMNETHPWTVKDKYFILKLFGHAYFRRIWVVQEVLLPDEVYVYMGDATTNTLTMSTLAAYFKAVHWLSGYLQRVSPAPLMRLQGTYNRTACAATTFSTGGAAVQTTPQETASWDEPIGYLDTPAIFDLLCETRTSECADSRDMVYGLLGLQTSSQSALLRVNYFLGVFQLGKDLCRALLGHGENRFFCCQLTRNHMPGEVLSGSKLEGVGNLDDSFVHIGRPTPIRQAELRDLGLTLREPSKHVWSVMGFVCDTGATCVKPEWDVAGNAITQVHQYNRTNVPWLHDWMPESTHTSRDGSESVEPLEPQLESVLDLRKISLLKTSREHLLCITPSHIVPVSADEAAVCYIPGLQIPFLLLARRETGWTLQGSCLIGSPSSIPPCTQCKSPLFEKSKLQRFDIMWPTISQPGGESSGAEKLEERAVASVHRS